MSRSASQHERVDWVDTAKGVCIVAVVTLYATHHLEDATGARGWMHALVDFAQPFRMPDFFLVSGLFLSRVLHKPWRSYADTKVVHYLYFYVLWDTLRFAATVAPHAASAREAVRGYLWTYVQPLHGPLWFIELLPAFFLAVRLMRALPPWLMVGLAAALKLLMPETGYRLVDRFAMYLVFVVGGYVLAPKVFAGVAWAGRHARESALFLAAWFVVNLLVVRAGVVLVPAVHLVTGFLGAAAVMVASAQLTRVPWMKWVRYLGEHSIVVYLSFVIPLAALTKLVVPRVPDVGLASLLVIVGSIVGSLVIHEVVRRTPLRFLFERPKWVTVRPRPLSESHAPRQLLPPAHASAAEVAAPVGSSPPRR